MNKISNVAIIQWQNELMKIKDDRGQTFSPTYLRTIHAQLSSILNHACRYYNMKTNVARDVGTMGEKEADEMLFWTHEEYETFIKAVKDKPQSYYAFEILYWTGIRLGELRALTKADFDFDKKPMRVSKSAQRINGEEIITNPKTPKSKRTIMLPDFLIRELKDYFLKIEYFSEDEQIFPK